MTRKLGGVRRVRGAFVLVVAVLMVTSMAAPAIATPADATASVGPQPTATGAPSPAPTAAPADQPADGPGSGIQAGGTVVANITLITGQTVTAIERDGEIHYQTDADVPMRTVRTENATYVFPADVDFSRFDPALFNVEYLRRHDLTDADFDSFPVIVTLDGRQVSTADDGQLDQLTDSAGIQHGRQLESLNAVAGQLDRATIGASYEQLRDSAMVDRVYLDAPIQVELDQVNAAMNADDARERFNVSGDGVVVAVLDTGVDESHPDLDDGTELAERDFTLDDTTADLNGHGTHVAGIVTGDGDASNGTYVGIAPDANIVDARVLNAEGFGLSSWIIDGMEWAYSEQNADVISMSLGGTASVPRSEDLFTPAVNAAVDNGTAVVIAAGNDGPGYATIGSPGIVKHAITVGATSADGRHLAGFSSKGPTFGGFVKPDVLAVGTSVRSAASSHLDISAQYVNLSGTSMATPAVSGAAALLIEDQPGIGPLEVKNRLISSGELVGGPTDVYAQGAGQVNLTDALTPGLVVSPGTIDFGPYASDTTATRVVTIENNAGSDRTVTLNATAVDVTDGDAGTVSLNRTDVTVPAGGSAAVALTIDTSDDAGLYSGRLRIDGETAASFGYLRVYNVTVEKQPLPNQSAVGDFVAFIPRRGGPLSTFRTGFVPSDGSTSFPSLGGEVTVVSPGFDDDTREAIFTARTVTVSQDRTVTLDEADTVRHQVDTADLEANAGDLTTLEFSATLQTQFSANGAASVFEFGSSTSGGPVTARFPTGSVYNASMQELMVPSSSTGSGAPMDAETAYHLVHTTTGISGAKTYQPSPSDLASFDVTYHRTQPGQTYSAFTVARTTRWGTFGHATLAYAIGDRVNQTLRVTPGTAAYGIGAAGANPETGATWQYAPLVSQTAPSPGATVAVDVNRQPLFGFQSWSMQHGGLTFIAGFQADREDNFLATSENNTFRFQLEGEAPLVGNTTSPFIGTTAPIPVDPNQTARLDMLGRNDAQPLSSRTLTTVQATNRPGQSDAPPSISDATVEGLNASNAVTGDQVTMFVTVADEQSVSVSAYVGTDTTTVPFSNSTGWQAASVSHVQDDRYAVTFDTAGLSGAVDVAVGAIDDHGDFMATTTRDAFIVAGNGTADDGPTEVTVGFEPGDTQVAPGETTTVDVVVRNVDNGVGAYNVTLTSANASAASIDDVGLPVGSGFDQVTWNDDENGSVTVEVAGLDTDDTGNVTVATVTVRGQANGSSTLGVDPTNVGDEDANAYSVVGTEVAPVTVTGETGPPALPGFDNAPTDPDGDGEYEDINGDGGVNVIDVQALFISYQSDTVQNNVDAFDFNDDGAVNIIDVQALFVEVVG